MRGQVAAVGSRREERSASRQRRSPLRRWSLAAAGLLVLSAGTWGISNVPESADGDSWAPVESQDLVIGVELEGELRAVDSADLGPPQVRSASNFKIAFMAPEGTEIEAGQPVLGFDTSELQRQLQQKVADRDSTVKELEKRITDLELERRDQDLQLAEAQAALRLADLKLGGTQRVSSQREVEEARIDRRLAQIQIDHLQSSRQHLEARSAADLAALSEKRDRAAARVQELEKHIRDMTVRAPRSGTVIYKSNWRGEKKKIGENAWRAEKVVQIPDLRRMRGEGRVAEADAGRIEVGQRVTFRLDAYPDQEYRASVIKIHRTVQQKSWRNPQKVVRLDVELEATDTERMRPGMRFRGEIEVERIADTLVIPRDAVFPQPSGTAVYVRTLFGRREVFPVFGERNSELFGVESGLAEGDRVLRRGGDLR